VSEDLEWLRRLLEASEGAIAGWSSQHASGSPALSVSAKAVGQHCSPDPTELPIAIRRSFASIASVPSANSLDF
jgi:hypothetical protein